MIEQIWRHAYDKYIDDGRDAMWEYLEIMIDSNYISRADADKVAEDVEQTAAL